MQLFGFEAKICSCIFLPPDGAILSSLSSKRYWQTSAVRSESFFDNEPKQILSAIPDLSAKNKQTVAPSIRGTTTTTKQPLLLLLRFQIIQSTLPYSAIIFQDGVSIDYITLQHVNKQKLRTLARHNFRCTQMSKVSRNHLVNVAGRKTKRKKQSIKVSLLLLKI